MKIEFLKPNENIETLVLGVASDGRVDAPHLPKVLGPVVDGVIKDRSAVFSGKVGESFFTVVDPSSGVRRVLLIGVEGAAATPGSLALLGAHAVKALIAQKIDSAHIGWHSIRVALQLEGDATHEASHFARGASLAAYRFSKYSKKEGDYVSLASLDFLDCDKMESDRIGAVQAVTKGTALARDLVNEPPNIINPATFVDQVKSQMKSVGVTCSVLEGADLEKLNMGCLMAVGRGSAIKPKLLLMEWKGGSRSAFDFGFVGKGVTFDSGGLCIKPGASMLDMKSDMAGGAAVVGAMYALAARKLKKNVVAAVPLAENMVSGDSYRPSDVLESFSGQTVEVIDTDAEGRLILADALSYVVKTYKPGTLIDLATLTGAVLVSLGVEKAGLFSNSETLAKLIQKAGAKVGEDVWRLPMGAEYESRLKSSVADIANLGSGMGAGSITAAEFLKKFIPEDQKWAHLDIAGTAYRAAESPLYQSKHATGYGVALLLGVVFGEDF